MLSAIQITNEYIQISHSLFCTLGESFAVLLNSISYLVTFVGADEPELVKWRCLTTGELGKVKYENAIPQESERGSRIFSVLTVGAIMKGLIFYNLSHF